MILVLRMIFLGSQNLIVHSDNTNI